MRIEFDLTRSQVSIEGDGPELIAVLEAVRHVAPKLSEIRITTGACHDPPESHNGTAGARRTSNQTMRDFARGLDLSSNSERIAAIAYYATKLEQRESFSAKDMGDWFTICGFQKPTQMPVALFDAKRKYGFLEKAGHGRWRISTQGENMVIGKTEAQRLSDD